MFSEVVLCGMKIKYNIRYNPEELNYVQRTPSEIDGAMC